MAEPFFIRKATDIEKASAFDAWGGLLITPARTYRAPEVEGAVLVLPTGEVGSAVTWFLGQRGQAEVTTLNAFVPGQGYGRTMLRHAEVELRRRGVRQAKLFTTNPNIGAITIFLRQGWRVVRIHLDAMDAVRAMKPAVPLEEDGLPLRDMWELVKEL